MSGRSLLRVAFAAAVLIGLGGCYYAPPPATGYYAYAPGYYAYPSYYYPGYYYGSPVYGSFFFRGRFH